MAKQVIERGTKDNPKTGDSLYEGANKINENFTELYDSLGPSSGDMTKAVYDTDNNGTVDNSEKVNNLTVETAVPTNALFTDTIYDDTSIQEEVTLNTAKVGITTQQTADITTNNSKVGVTTEEANTIDSIISGEPTGSDVVLNVVSLTQAEYDAGTPIVTTFYIITDA